MLSAFVHCLFVTECHTRKHKFRCLSKTFFMLQPISAQRHVDENKNFILRHL